MKHRRQFKDSTGRGRCQEQYFSVFWPLQWPQRPSETIFYQRVDSSPPQVLSEWPPKNSNPYSPIFGPHFPVGPKMDPGQCIKVFQAKKTGSGVSQGAQWAVFCHTVEICWFKGKFFFQFLGPVLPGEYFFVKTVIGSKLKLDSEPKFFWVLRILWSTQAKTAKKWFSRSALKINVLVGVHGFWMCF